LLHALLILFAADAERRLGPCLETLDRNLLATLLTDSEATVFDLAKCLLDFVEEHFFAATETKRERLEVFARGEVHLVRQIVRVERHVFLERLLRLLDDLVALLREQRLELLELNLVHRTASG